jgi:hypothetical protein
VTKSDSRVTEGFEAMESTKQGKSDQSDIVYKEQILTILRKQATRANNIWPQIGPRSTWDAIKADMNAMLDLDIIAWDGDYLMIAPSA